MSQPVRTPGNTKLTPWLRAVAAGGRKFLKLALAAAGAAGAGRLPRLTHSMGTSDVPTHGEWQVLNPADPPAARSGHTMVTFPDEILCFGGENSSQNLYNDLYSYIRDNDKWEPVPPANTPPPERKNHAAWSSNEHMYVHGGVGQNNQHFDDLWKYDPQKREWVAVEVSGSKPSARRYHAAATNPSDGAALIVGGIDANNIALDDVWLFSDDSFTLLGNCQQSVGTPQAHWIGDMLYLLGDGDGKVVTYNLADNTSSVLTGGPPVMNCASALWEGLGQQLVFVFGGREKTPPFNESQLVYVYDIKTGITTVRKELMPFPHSNGACARLQPPSRAHAATQITAAPLMEVLFFGGKSGSAYINTTFKFSLWQGSRIFLPLVMRNS